MVLVHSTCIYSAGFLPTGANTGTLLLTFQNRPNIVYEYPDVLASIYTQLVNGVSVGQGFHKYIKGRYCVKYQKN